MAVLFSGCNSTVILIYVGIVKTQQKIIKYAENVNRV